MMILVMIIMTVGSGLAIYIVVQLQVTPSDVHAEVLELQEDVDELREEIKALK